MGRGVHFAVEEEPELATEVQEGSLVAVESGAESQNLVH
jgi:hypothetical protein